MESPKDISAERYFLHPNEPIDKLTVNRAFERMFEDIDSISAPSKPSLPDATEDTYGKARFSGQDAYEFSYPVSGSGESTEEYQARISDYENGMLRIGQLDDMSRRISGKFSDSFFMAPSGETVDGEISGTKYWLRSEYSRTKFSFLPNGVNIVACSFDVGFNGLSMALGVDDLARRDVTTPISLSSYDDTVSMDRESVLNVEDFISDWTSIEASCRNDGDMIRTVYSLDGATVSVPFVEPLSVLVRHNRCPSRKYSSYMRSYIEVCMSTKLSVRSLFDERYMLNTYELVGDGSEATALSSTSYGSEMPRKPRLFTQRPIVMSQIGFFNNRSNPHLLVGADTRPSLSENAKLSFSSHSRISQKPLDEDVRDGCEVSPVNGSVFVRDVSNVYDGDGNVVDNTVSLSVTLKLMAGSPTDPEMEYATRFLNSRSRVQLALIGV